MIVAINRATAAWISGAGDLIQFVINAGERQVTDHMGFGNLHIPDGHGITGHNIKTIYSKAHISIFIHQRRVDIDTAYIQCERGAGFPIVTPDVKPV